MKNNLRIKRTVILLLAICFTSSVLFAFTTVGSTDYTFNNVGIGTDQPSEKLEVRGNMLVKGGDTFTASPDSATIYLGDTNHYIKSEANKGLHLSTWEVPVGIVLQEETGYVGIGELNPKSKLHVKGGIFAEKIRFIDPDSGSIHGDNWIGNQIIDGHMRLIIGGTTSGGISRIAYAAASNYFMGNIGIGKSEPQYQLDVAGTVAATNYNCLSDRRYKKDIVPVNNAMHKLSLLNGVYYNWKTKEFQEKGFTKKRDMGFIAQDLEKIFPEVVYTDSKGYKSVAYSKLTAVIVEALKEQNKEVISLKKENAELKQQVASLQKMSKRIARLEKKVKSQYVGMK